MIIENVSLSYSSDISKINGSVSIVPGFALLQNYPNPFNPETWIPFKLEKGSLVTISIYNIKGQVIRALHLGNKDAGVYTTKNKSAYWDGKNSLGQSVSSGAYFYHIPAECYLMVFFLLYAKW